MAAVHVCYGTGEGQTEKVADRLADELTSRGHDPTTVEVKAVGSDLDVADFDEDGAAEATTYVQKFVEATNWRSDRIGLFGGAIRFSEYGFLLGALMKRVVESGFPDVDASGDVEFTDWESVEAFADAFATFVEERTGDARGTE